MAQSGERLPSGVGVPTDPFAHVDSVRFLSSWSFPLPGQYKLWDPERRLLGQVRRDGTGFHNFLMNFALEDPAGQPWLLIRQPMASGVHFHLPFSLRNPQGSEIGQLWWSWRQVAQLVLADGTSFMAQVPGWTWKGFDVLSKGVRVGTVTYPNPFFPRPTGPGGLQLEMGPGLGRANDRLFTVAFVAFVAIFKQVRAWPTY